MTYAVDWALRANYISVSKEVKRTCYLHTCVVWGADQTQLKSEFKAAGKKKQDKNVSTMTAVDLDLCDGPTFLCYEYVSSGMAGCFDCFEAKHAAWGRRHPTPSVTMGKLECHSLNTTVHIFCATFMVKLWSRFDNTEYWFVHVTVSRFFSFQILCLICASVTESENKFFKFGVSSSGV